MSDGGALLLVLGGPEVERRVWDERGHGYWSAAFPASLERFGWLDLTIEGPGVLAEPERLAAFDLVVVAWLPADLWTAERLAGVEAAETAFFLEGPIEPPALRRLAGLAEPPGPRVASLLLEPRDPVWLGAAADLRATLEAQRLGTPESFELAGKQVDLRYAPPDHVILRSRPATDDPMADAERLAIGFLFGLWRRAQERASFFEPAYQEAAASLAVAEAVARLAPGRHREALAEALESVVEARLACGEEADLVGPTKGPRRRAAQASWAAVARLMAARHREVAERLRAKLPQGVDDSGRADLVKPRFQATLEACDGVTVAPDERLPECFEGLDLGDLLMLAAAAEDRSTGLALLGHALSVHAPERAAFHEAKIEGGRLVPGPGIYGQAWIPLALIRLAPRLAVEDAGEAAAAAYAPEHRRRWAAQPFEAELATAEGAVSQMLGSRDEARGLVAGRHGRFGFTTFQALAAVGHAYTVHPLGEPFADCRLAGFMALERMLLAAFAETAAEARRGLARVAAWPWGRHYCLTVRHDVDRIPDPAAFERLIGLHGERGHAVTWFWISDRLDAGQIATEEAAGHEIALHTTTAAGKAEELAALGARLTRQQRIVGECWHGGGGDRWGGAPSVEAAQRAGLAYTELLMTLYGPPLGCFPYPTAEGEIRLERSLIGMTDTASPDTVPYSPYKTDTVSVPGVAAEFAAAGFHLCLLNHPDINFEALAAWSAALPRQSRLNWTCAQVASWWRATHQAGNLYLRRLESSDSHLRLRLEPRRDAVDVELRVLGLAFRPGRVSIDGAPAGAWLDEGSEVRLALDLAAGTPREVLLEG